MLDPVHASNLETAHISIADDDSVNWLGSFAAYGGNGADSTAIVPFSIGPGGHPDREGAVVALELAAAGETRS